MRFLARIISSARIILLPTTQYGGTGYSLDFTFMGCVHSCLFIGPWLAQMDFAHFYIIMLSSISFIVKEF